MIRRLVDLLDQINRHKLGAEWDAIDARDSGVPAYLVTQLTSIADDYARVHKILQKRAHAVDSASLRLVARDK